MEGPHSSYSCLEIHICWKVEREARMEPPIQTEYFLSGGAMILILMVEGARAVISFVYPHSSTSSTSCASTTPFFAAFCKRREASSDSESLSNSITARLY